MEKKREENRRKEIKIHTTSYGNLISQKSSARILNNQNLPELPWMLSFTMKKSRKAKTKNRKKNGTKQQKKGKEKEKA